MQSPYQTFNNWLFDSDIKSEFPKPTYDENGNQLTYDLLKYNSPITPSFLIKLFMKNPILNHYLNEVFNNTNLWYLPKEEFFLFIKKCVIDFKIKRNSLMFFSYQKKNILFDKISNKLPSFKKDDILLICEKIDQSEYKDMIYSSLGMIKETKQVIKNNKNKTKKKNEKISMKDIIKKHFIIEEIPST